MTMVIPYVPDEQVGIEIKNLKQYVKDKVKIAKRDFFVQITPEQVAYLYTLKSGAAVDSAVRRFIKTGLDNNNIN